MAQNCKISGIKRLMIIHLSDRFFQGQIGDAFGISNVRVSQILSEAKEDAEECVFQYEAIRKGRE